MKRPMRGEATKQRVLEEACRVFAERGFRDATHMDICTRAGTNQAAVNYYFGSKEELYRAACAFLMEEIERQFPFNGGLPTNSPAAARLRELIRALLNRVFVGGPLGDLHLIMRAEMFEPTGMLDELMGPRLMRDRAYVQGVIRELMGEGAAERDVEFCEMSVVSQCLVGADTPREERGPRALFKLDPGEVERLTEHIYRFSLAGIQAFQPQAPERPRRRGKHRGIR